jgi:hypothetical protein
MYKDRALVRFRRYFLHSIRDGKNAEEAAAESMWKAREETLAEIEADPLLKDKISKEGAWSTCLEILSILRMCFVDYDEVYEQRKLQAKQAKDLVERIKSPVEETTSVAQSLVTGMEHKVEEEQKLKEDDCE